MAPRISPRYPPREESSYGLWRERGDRAPLETRAFWNYLTAPGGMEVDPRELMVEEEQRILSKAASGGGFLVPTDLGDQIVSAARAQSPLARQALEIVTDDGASLGLPLAGTHGTALWTAESGSVTLSDETITQATLSAFKGTSKLIVSEELLTDEEVRLDQYLADELGARLGALQGAAFAAWRRLRQAAWDHERGIWIHSRNGRYGLVAAVQGRRCGRRLQSVARHPSRSRRCATWDLAT
jgi:hypothetical protein